MKKSLGKSLARYSDLLQEVKTRIRHAQNRAAQAANTELLRLYWDIGRLILARQKTQGWGAGVIPRLARDLHNELPEIKGFSERNIKLMMQFAREYPDLFPIGQPVVAQLPTHVGFTSVGSPSRADLPAQSLPGSIGQPLVAQLPWAHNILLIQAVKDLPTRRWYMQESLKHGWSRNMLALMIDGDAHLRQGKAINNFSERLPSAQSDLAIQLLKDPYIFDFLTLEEPFHERELETQLLHHVEKFLLELGQGFAFVGRQYRIDVGGKDFSIDLLFYHLHLRCFIVIDLKTKDFEAEHAGKMNFYLSVLDDKLRHASDAPSIGLILCKKRDRIIAEYALRGIDRPIGISEYKLTRALPRQLQSSLPTIAQIEAELTSKTTPARPARRRPTQSARPRRRSTGRTGSRRG